MAWRVTDSYPPDAVWGADFFTGSPQREVIDVDNAGRDVRRKERIVVSEREILDGDIVEGRICVSEQTIRSIGGELGLVDRRQMEHVVDDNERLRRRLNDAETENTQLRNALAALQAIGAPRGPVADVMPDTHTAQPLVEV